MTVTAIVIAGAGARGAYEAGLLGVLVPRLLAEPDRDPADRVVVLGTSAGAINAAMLASVQDPQEGIANAHRLWTSIEVSDIFAALRRTAMRNMLLFALQLLGRKSRIRSVLDSSPLERTMRERLDWDALRRNLATGGGWIDTACVVTTAWATGRTNVFHQGATPIEVRSDDIRGIDYFRADLDVPHVLASSAIPIAFRPARVEAPDAAAGWHIDGGVRQNCPIRPALDLGADRVVVVATSPDPDLPRPAPEPLAPDVADVGGVALEAVLVDRMAEDVRSLRRVNGLLAARRPEVGGDDHRVVPHIYLGPPAAGVISAAANRVFEDRYRGWAKLSDLGVLGRILGGSKQTHGELLSFLFFDGAFHSELLDLGRSHASDALGPPGGPLPWRA